MIRPTFTNPYSRARSVKFPYGYARGISGDGKVVPVDFDRRLDGTATGAAICRRVRAVPSSWCPPRSPDSRCKARFTWAFDMAELRVAVGISSPSSVLRLPCRL